MTPKWYWTLKGQRYWYVKLLPTSPKFHSVLLYDRSFSSQIIEVLDFCIVYNGEFEIVEKKSLNRKLKF